MTAWKQRLLWLASTVAVAATVYSIVGPATAVALLSCVIVFALVLVRATLRFCASTRSYCIVATGTFEKEVRPPTDGVFHVLLFQWHTFGTGRLYQCMLRWLNRGYDDWDDDFKDLGIDAAAWVQEYCERYGISNTPWIWSKRAAEYTTKNDWFARKYTVSRSPEQNCGDADILMPATAVVSHFSSVLEMPRLVKNDRFTITECGIPDHHVYESHPCALLYLAPADYHCFHAPVSGMVTCCRMLGMERHSASVKQYIYEHTNILASNRRAVIVIESRSPPLRCAMVVIGGVTVDSIRLESTVREGAEVSRGQLVGCFARGGSSVALFFDRHVTLVSECEALNRSGVDFKLDCAASLAHISKAG